MITTLRPRYVLVKDSSIMRAKVRVLSRTHNPLKKMRKINLVPGRGTIPDRKEKRIQQVVVLALKIPPEIAHYGMRA